MSSHDDRDYNLPIKGFVVPDFTEAVEGWRVWHVDRQLPMFGTAPKLYSVTHDYFWRAQRLSRATCERDNEHVPGEGCHCGFYAAKTYAQLRTQGYKDFKDGSRHVAVIGQVALWGKVIEGTQGWRAEKAYPARLWVPYQGRHLARALANAYLVPVGVTNFLREETSPPNPKQIGG